MLVIGMVLGYKLNESGDTYSLIEEVTSDKGLTEYGRVEEVVRFIENKYAYDLSTEDLLEDALTAVVHNLDPYSNYISPADLDGVNNRTSGIYYGVGIESYQQDSATYISKVYPDSPAMKAGLRAFDEIIRINDITLKDSSFSLSNVKEVLGDYDSLYFDILRLGVRSTIALKESDIPVSPISIACKLEEGMYYAKIDAFSEGVYRILMDSIENLEINNPEHHLILDVRGNRGGLLPEVANMLSQFFSQEDVLLVSTKGEHQKEERYTTTGKPFFTFGNIAVLVDENSASAAEILAGAIQDLDRGIVIGTPSYGKGLVQEQYLLSNNGALRLTVAEYFLPSGRCIQKELDNDRKDSLTVQYFSLMKNRPMINGNGIHPDIMADAQYSLSESDQLNMYEWAFNVVKENQYKDANYWSKRIDASSDLINSYTSQYPIVSEMSEANMYQALLDALEYYQVFNMESSLRARYLLTDPVIDTAVKQLRKKDIFEY